MEFHKQAFLHKPEEGVYGDCYRTCLACLLDLERDEVPQYYGPDISVDEVLDLYDEWLAERGLIEITVLYSSIVPLQEILDSVANCNPKLGFYMLTGTSKTDVNHVVICNGNQIVHDTSLNNAGIIGPADDGFYRISFLGLNLL